MGCYQQPLTYSDKTLAFFKFSSFGVINESNLHDSPGGDARRCDEQGWWLVGRRFCAAKKRVGRSTCLTGSRNMKKKTRFHGKLVFFAVAQLRRRIITLISGFGQGTLADDLKFMRYS